MLFSRSPLGVFILRAGFFCGLLDNFKKLGNDKVFNKQSWITETIDNRAAAVLLSTCELRSLIRQDAQ